MFLISESSTIIMGKIEKAACPGNVSLTQIAIALFFDSIAYEQCDREMEIEILDV